MTGVIAARAKQVGRHLRGDGEDLSRPHLVATHGDRRRRRRHGRFPALGCGQQHLRPIARRRRQCRDACEEAIGHERWRKRRHRRQRASSVAHGRSVSPAPGMTSPSGTRSLRRQRKALATISTACSPDLAANDLLDGASRPRCWAGSPSATTLEDALAGAIHVQENTPENRRREARSLRRARRGCAGREPCSRVPPRRSCHPPSPKHLAGRASLPRRPSDQSALSDPGRRGRARALDDPPIRRADRAPSCARPAMRRSS